MADHYIQKLKNMIENAQARKEELQRDLQALEIRVQTLREALSEYERTAGGLEAPRGTAPIRAATGVRPSRSKFGFVMDRIQDAGERGLTPKEMYDAARRAGIDIKPNTVRSQVWHAKKAGKLEEVDGRYRIPMGGDEEAPEGDDPPGASFALN